MARYTETLRDQNGAAIAGAYVSVLDPEGATAVLTDDADQPLDNPFLTDVYGVYTYNVEAEGFYTNIFTYGGRQVFKEVVLVGVVADILADIEDAATATAADVVLTHADVVLTHADVVLTHADVVLTHADVALTHADVVTAAASASSAALASAIAGSYPNSAASNVPRGLTQASVGAITAGSGGTNGTFAIVWTGGNFTIAPTGTITVAGGALTAVTITGPGLYIGAAPSAPQINFGATSTGLAGGVACTLTSVFLVTSGQGYWVQSADGTQLLRYNNVSGTATVATGVGPIDIPVAFTALTDANSETVRPGKTEVVNLDHTTAGVDLWNPLGSGLQPQAFVQDGSNTRVFVSWEIGATSLLPAGKLVEAELHTGLFDQLANVALPTTTGAKVQCWVVRPTAPPSDTDAAAISVNLVAAVGEKALDNSQADYRDNICFSGFEIAVQAGDMLAWRVIGAAIRYGVNSGGSHDYDNSRSALFSIADLTLAGAFATTQSSNVTSTTGRRFFHRATVIPAGYIKSGRGPNTPLRLDATARIPTSVSRLPDNPWHGKKVAFFGSSINTYTGGGTGAIKGHIPMVAEMLQCDPYYFAVGGSLGCWPTSGWGGASAYSAGTAAEFLARYGAGGDPAQYSFERRWTDNSGFDAVVMHDYINDISSGGGGSFPIGVKGSTSRNELWGSLPRMIEYFLDASRNPKCQVFLTSAAHVWASYPGTGAPTENTGRLLWTDALSAIALEYRLPPVIDFTRQGGISAFRVQNGSGLIDVVHPAETNGPKPGMAGMMYAHMVRYGVQSV